MTPAAHPHAARARWASRRKSHSGQIVECAKIRLGTVFSARALCKVGAPSCRCPTRAFLALLKLRSPHVSPTALLLLTFLFSMWRYIVVLGDCSLYFLASRFGQANRVFAASPPRRCVALLEIALAAPLATVLKQLIHLHAYRLPRHKLITYY